MLLRIEGSAKTLRLDQATAISKLREAVKEGQRRIVMAAPTGMGKTVIAASMVETARAKDKRVLITVPALSLVDQTVEVLGAQGINDIGVMQANHAMTDCTQPVQVASIQTLMRRQLPKADLVIIDECHKFFKFYEKWFTDPEWQRVPFIGLSATPWTKGLGAYYSKLILASTITELIEQKILSPFRVFAPTHPDLKGVRTVAGDYHEGDLHEVMRPARLVADIVASWKQLAGDRPTVCFGVNRAHAEQIKNEFEAAGVPAGYMDCETPVNERGAIRSQLLRGLIKVVCNVDVIGLGVDWPEIGCIVYARPTKSEMRYVQNIGRGLRVAPDKADLLVIDHSDTTLRLGFVSEIVHDELHDGKPTITAQKVVTLPKECPACHYLKPPRTAKCPNCGHVTEHHAKPVVNAPGELQELVPGGARIKVAPVAAKLGGKAETYGQLLWHARSHGYRDGWAANKYREIYGVWPRGLDYGAHMQAPDMHLASWIKAGQIRWAKGQKRQRWNDEAVNGTAHTNGNGHVNGNGQAAPGDKTSGALIPGTLMTEEDLKYFD